MSQLSDLEGWWSSAYEFLEDEIRSSAVTSFPFNTSFSIFGVTELIKDGFVSACEKFV